MLHDEVQEILCRAVCAWAGVPLMEAEVKQRASELGALIEGPAAIGAWYWRARQSRQRTEKWTRDLITKVRRGKLKVPDGSALHIIAGYRDLHGKLLDTQIAAVELLNVLRPTVAISRFIIFAALALHEHPESSTEAATWRRCLS